MDLRTGRCGGRLGHQAARRGREPDHHRRAGPRGVWGGLPGVDDADGSRGGEGGTRAPPEAAEVTEIITIWFLSSSFVSVSLFLRVNHFSASSAPSPHPTRGVSPPAP